MFDDVKPTSLAPPCLLQQVQITEVKQQPEDDLQNRVYRIDNYCDLPMLPIIFTNKFLCIMFMYNGKIIVLSKVYYGHF